MGADSVLKTLCSHSYFRISDNGHSPQNLFVLYSEDITCMTLLLAFLFHATHKTSRNQVHTLSILTKNMCYFSIKQHIHKAIFNL